MEKRPSRHFIGKLAVLVGAALLVACGAVAQAGDPQASGKVTAFLGEDLVSIIAAADRVEPYLLKPSLAPTTVFLDAPGVISGYNWKARGADLAPADVARFKALLLDSASYDFETAKKCPMVPEYAFRFHAGERSTNVLVSFGCTMWAFPKGEDIRVEDFDPVADQLKKIVETVFKLD